jgi:hypothetical protein
VSIMVWAVLFAMLVIVAFIAVRMAAKHEEDGLHDTGLAIIEFNRAFPKEAIRALQATADGQVVFVRLHDNKAGFMRNMQRHYSCQVIQPGRVRVLSSQTGKGLTDRVPRCGASERHLRVYLAEGSLGSGAVAAWQLRGRAGP